MSGCSQDWLRQLLVAPTKSSPLLEPRYATPSEFSHLRVCRKPRLWQLSLLESLARSPNALQLCPGDVEKNPGPVSTANAETQSKKSKFLTIIHVNVCSLFRHSDDLTSLASAKHSHIIAISETWLVTNIQIHLAAYNLPSRKSHPSRIWNTLKLTTASSAVPEKWSSINLNKPSSIANSLNSHFTSVSSSTFNPEHPTPSLPHLNACLLMQKIILAFCKDAVEVGRH